MPNTSTPNPPNGWTVYCSECNEFYDTPIEPKPGGRWEACRPCAESAKAKFKRGRMVMYDIAMDHKDALATELGPGWDLQVHGSDGGYGITARDSSKGRHKINLTDHTTPSDNVALNAALNKVKNK